MGFERPRRGLFQTHAAAAGVRVNRAADAGALDRAAAGVRVHLALHRIELNTSGAGLDANVIVHAGNRDGPRTGLQLRWTMDTLHTLAARSGAGAQAGLAGHHQFVADGDVAAQPFVLGHADPDAVAGLGNRRICLDLVDTVPVAAEEIVVRADDAVDAHAGSIAGTHLDAAGARLDIQIDSAVDGESAVEGAFPLGRSRLQDQSGVGQDSGSTAKSH